jgi:uncharacterized membrane protein YqjE
MNAYGKKLIAILVPLFAVAGLLIALLAWTDIGEAIALATFFGMVALVAVGGTIWVLHENQHSTNFELINEEAKIRV